jgi:hypothetical protein
MAWRHDALPDSRIPDSLKARLADFQRRTPLHRQVLIRQCYRPRRTVRCLQVRTSEVGPTIHDVEAADYEALGATELGTAFANAAGSTGPIYTVCTHGTHDKCCAKFGLQVYRALAREQGDAVWQCSHIGGDRFAGNVVVFPYGIYYGRVTPDDVPGLVEHTNRREILLAHYRGRCCYPRIVQAAEYFLRSESGRLGISDFVLTSVTRTDQNEATVRFRSAHDHSTHSVALRTIPNALTAQLTCDAEIPSAITQYELIRYADEGR